MEDERECSLGGEDDEIKPQQSEAGVGRRAHVGGAEGGPHSQLHPCAAL